MNKNNAKALSTLRQKIRKYNRDYETEIAAYKEVIEDTFSHWSCASKHTEHLLFKKYNKYTGSCFNYHHIGASRAAQCPTNQTVVLLGSLCV